MVFKQEKDFKGFKDFILPDFKIEVKLKDQSLPDSLKKVFEVSTTLENLNLKLLHQTT